MTSPQPQGRSKKIIAALEIVICLVAIGLSSWFIVSQRFNIYDWLKLRGYHPPSAVSSLADQDTMTAYARRLFYVNHPSVDTKASFAGVCPNGTEQTVVLGCFHSGENGIYLLSVNNPELSGIVQVTAAHETLHAIYEQLSSSERTKVDGMLLNYYNHGLSDPVIKAQIASYRQTEPDAVINEMHSLFGTEVANLPPDLEAYYSKYFTNRQAIVANYQHYEAAFTSRQQQIAADDNQLKTWLNQISSNSSQLNSKLQTINSQQATLSGYKNSGQLSLYNQGVAAYNQLVDQYNDLVDTNKSLVSQYNQLVNSRNSIVLEEQQLVKAISPTQQTISN